MKTTLSLLFALAALGTSPAWSQAAHDHAHGVQVKPVATATAAAPTNEGEVRKVDKEQAKVTIKHGEIKSLNMPPMTMTYPVTDAAMLDKVKAGDKVLFSAASDKGKLTVTGIKLVK